MDANTKEQYNFRFKMMMAWGLGILTILFPGFMGLLFYPIFTAIQLIIWQDGFDWFPDPENYWQYFLHRIRDVFNVGIGLFILALIVLEVIMALHCGAFLCLGVEELNENAQMVYNVVTFVLW